MEDSLPVPLVVGELVLPPEVPTVPVVVVIPTVVVFVPDVEVVVELVPEVVDEPVSDGPEVPEVLVVVPPVELVDVTVVEPPVTVSIGFDPFDTIIAAIPEFILNSAVGVSEESNCETILIAT